MLHQDHRCRGLTNVKRPFRRGLSSGYQQSIRGGVPFSPGFVSVQSAIPAQALDFRSSLSSRLIVAFFLGLVFWSGISHACQSRFSHKLVRVCWRLIRRSKARPDVEALAPSDIEKSRQQRLSSIHCISNETALAFTLNLCFAFAGFAEFCSLLTYSHHADATCGTCAICNILSKG